MRADSRASSILTAAAVLLAALGTAVNGQTPPPQTRPPGRAQPRSASPPRAATGETAEATTRRICGSVCHPIENAINIRRTRGQWEAVVETMIGKGAKGTSAEFATVIEYLATSHSLGAAPVRGSAGPDDKPLVDPTAAEMGRPLYVTDCQACHGPDARGTSEGANLVRSLVVLSDRYGSTLGPYLRSSHPPVPVADKANVKGPAFEALTNTQVLTLAHFLRDRLNDTLRGSPFFKPGDVLTGDPKAGAEFFNGQGGCAQCHSPTGDFAAIGKRMDPVTLQQRFLFPSNAGSRRRTDPAPVVKVTITTPSGGTLSGDLIQIDDFNVSLRDASGAFHSARRTPEVSVTKNDPFAAHIALLSTLTDKSIHDVVAYLETLK
jgi:mono/diheme cytochrome c family protein